MVTQKQSLFQTGDSISAVVTEIKAELPISDSNKMHSLLMKMQNTIIHSLAQEGMLNPNHPNFK